MTLSQLKNKNVVLYILSKSPERSMNRLKLVKLIWLADRLHINKYGRKITKTSYVAMPHGPVASEILDLLKSDSDAIKPLGTNNVALENPDLKYLSSTDIESLDYIYDSLKDNDRFELRDFSHLFPEWKRFEDLLNDKSLPNSYPMIEEDFFIENEYMNLVPSEIRESSRSEYTTKKAILASLGG